MSTNDVTIYHPGSVGLFRRSIMRSGGAERQMALLERELARKGHRVALIVYPVPDPIPDLEAGLTLIERGPHSGTSGIVGVVRESARVFRSLWAANGRVVIVRGGTPVLGFVALYCRLRRRRLVFSSANNFDFLPREDTSGPQARLYGFGVRQADAVVVQSLDQVDLAKKAFPEIRRLVHIASFADEPRDNGVTPEPTALIWAGRMVSYKRPDHFVDLAAAVPEARFILIPHVGVRTTAKQKELLEGLRVGAMSVPNLELGVSLAHADLIEKFASAVAVVNTSDFEGMPNTFLEAWGQGVPVLTLSFDPDGVVEREGLGVAAGGSWERFVAGARELWEGRGDREAISERTKAYVRTVHSLPAVGSQWEELLRSLGAFE